MLFVKYDRHIGCRLEGGTLIIIFILCMFYVYFNEFMHGWWRVCVCMCMGVLCLRGGCMVCVAFPAWVSSYLLNFRQCPIMTECHPKYYWCTGFQLSNTINTFVCHENKGYAKIIMPNFCRTIWRHSPFVFSFVESFLRNKSLSLEVVHMYYNSSPHP